MLFRSEAKQLLTGVHLSLAGAGLECAATDGHRLAVQRLDDALAPGSEALEADAGEAFAVTVPARSLRELERLLSGRPSLEPLSLFSERGQVVVLGFDPEREPMRSWDGRTRFWSKLMAIPTVSGATNPTREPVLTGLDMLFADLVDTQIGRAHV